MTGPPGLLDAVLDAHGGLARWHAARELTVRLRSGGLALAARLRPRAFSAYTARISLAEPRVVITPYPAPGRRGLFLGDRVRLESEAGTVIAERVDPRAAFRRLRRALWWDHLDALYFAGYALWNYLTTPLLLTRPGLRLRELDGWEERGERWQRLAVVFPPGLPTHSAEQVFYDDRAGLLRRHDYTAEVFGGWARAAHYSGDHRTFGGLLVPTRRRVVPRRADNRARGGPTLIWIEVDDLTVSS